MSTTTDLAEFKINYLTQAQYDEALEDSLINENEIYLTPSSGGGVTGVKGNSESSYRTGQVNLTAANIGAQSTLVSGENIKTINNTSLLGSGNISISGGTQAQIIRW